MADIPRVLIAGTNSGCGKTTITCAILQAFINRGLKTGSFKCGPDYIDPMFHRRIIGAGSANLDLFFFRPAVLKCIFADRAAGNDINIIEGVMGFYDGIISQDITEWDNAGASTFEAAQITQSPVILTVNAAGSLQSVPALIHGFYDWKKNSGICGVILNKCSKGSYDYLAKVIYYAFGGKIKPLGYMPVMKESSLESRHLGLVTAAEVDSLKEKMNALAEQAEESIDLEAILKLAAQAPALECTDVFASRCSSAKSCEDVRIAVAKDKAFCFYYDDSLALLERMGARLVEFSPLDDVSLPENTDGIYIGGGYPELYIQQLSRNVSMRKSIRNALEDGMPCIAECGGFMYISEKIADAEMVGYLPGHFYDTGKLRRFGYVTLKANKDNMLCKKGDQIPAHEFHYWDCEYTGQDFEAIKPSGRSWSCVFADEHLYAGFPHFNFCANPEFAENYINACRKYKAGTVSGGRN